MTDAELVTVTYSGPLRRGRVQLASGRLVRFERGIPIEVPSADAARLDELWQTGSLPAGEVLEVPAPASSATVAEVLEWVAGSPERAAEALPREQARSRPRSSLLADLEALVASDPNQDGPVPDTKEP